MEILTIQLSMRERFQISISITLTDEFVDGHVALINRSLVLFAWSIFNVLLCRFNYQHRMSSCHLRKTPTKMANADSDKIILAQKIQLSI